MDSIIKKVIEVDIVFTSEELGKAFACLDGEQMADFFNAVASEAATWKAPFCFQMQYVTDAQNLTKEAREILYTFGQYADESAKSSQEGE